jgi:hypothetical protein
MVCTICGLSLRRHEFERAQDSLDDQVWEVRYGEKDDDRAKRRREYETWWEEGVHKKTTRNRAR